MKLKYFVLGVCLFSSLNLFADDKPSDDTSLPLHPIAVPKKHILPTIHSSSRAIPLKRWIHIYSNRPSKWTEAHLMQNNDGEWEDIADPVKVYPRDKNAQGWSEPFAHANPHDEVALVVADTDDHSIRANCGRWEPGSPDTRTRNYTFYISEDPDSWAGPIQCRSTPD